jgi:hypothetical protein
MPKIELTDEQAEELRDTIAACLVVLQADRIFDPSDADDIATLHRLSVLSDILHLLEIA